MKQLLWSCCRGFGYSCARLALGRVQVISAIQRLLGSRLWLGMRASPSPQVHLSQGFADRGHLHDLCMQRG
jgi:hypothetical protein